MKISRHVFFLSSIAIIISHVVILAITEFIDWPEILLYPWLLHNGFTLYTTLLIPYQPLVLLFLQVIYNLLGYWVDSLRILHIIFITTVDFALLCILYKTTKSYRAAFFGILIYSLLQPMAEGNSLWFDHFALPGLAFGYYFTLKAIQSKRASVNTVCAIICVGITILIKQTMLWVLGILFLYPLIDYFFLKSKNYTYKMPIIGTLSLLFPFAQFLYFFFKNQGDNYFFWVYQFGFGLRNDPNYVIPPNIYGDYPFILMVALTLALALLALKIKPRQWIIGYDTTWFGFAILTMFPRWTLTHFQAPLLFLIILFAHLVHVYGMNGLKKNITVLLIITIFILLSLKIEYTYIKNHIFLSYRFYTDKTKNTIEAIKQTKSKESYFLFGNTEYFYVYLHEIPLITPYIQLFPWNTQIPGIQEEQIEMLEKKKIRYIFYAPYHPNNVFYNGQKPEKLSFYLINTYELIENIGDINVYMKKDAN